MTAFLDSLDVDSPRLSLRGTVHINQAESSARIEMNCKEVDVHSLRETALSLAGNTPFVQQIFAVVRGGNVSFIILKFSFPD